MKNLYASILLMCGCNAWAVDGGPLRDVEIGFAMRAGESAVHCAGPAVRLGVAATPARLRDARLYVHNVRLLARDGAEAPLQLEQNEWQYLNVALLDFEDGAATCEGTAAVNTAVRGKVAAGDFVGLAFDLGVPVSAPGPAGAAVPLNHSNSETAPAPLDIAAMGWSWQAGRKFIKLELLPEGGVKRKNDTTKVWTIHLGSTACVGNPTDNDTVKCGNPNRRTVRFERFEQARDLVLLDLARLLEYSDIGRDEGGAAGCMSWPADPECGPVFRQLGLPLRPGEGRGGAGQSAADQALPAAFRRVAK
ncbi:MbnP family copper-binding protein [Rugamonas rubra]|uniref:Methanobactin biosynthesis cassette protein MbnP n=1 Tax=Rugamonas rubra TaxID=758825 RepID=A0A1I4LEZ0_9BURK|nr:MbnP family copper-binding protein [Rugamonas rubra]SFL89648.1 Methanobactin biosynthesis cassette protein MbnP [Rugamonas rubra]